MRIPKADGTTQPNNDSCSNWTDILCDKCGKSCRDSGNMNFEYAEVKATWGYGSNKDGDQHEAQVCETCYDAMGLKPAIKNYLFDRNPEENIIQGVWRCETCGWTYEGRCLTAMNDPVKDHGIGVCDPCRQKGPDERGMPTGLGGFSLLPEIEAAVWRTEKGLGKL